MADRWRSIDRCWHKDFFKMDALTS